MFRSSKECITADQSQDWNNRMDLFNRTNSKDKVKMQLSMQAKHFLKDNLYYCDLISAYGCNTAKIAHCSKTLIRAMKL